MPGKLIGVAIQHIGHHAHPVGRALVLQPEQDHSFVGMFVAKNQLAEKLSMPANLLKASLRRSLFEIEQCLTS